MKLEYYNRCTSATLKIDGKDWDDFSPKKQRTIALKVLNFLEDNDSLREFVSCVVEQYGDTKFDGRCSICGDSDYLSTLEID